jgi:UDP-N-acetylglucosamine--N-acetylmuramyl-(pentapeptide) pyrophosphoryl-undecaprenol N-acetylglucosamine transferase
VAEEIRRRNLESQVLFVGTRQGLEARLVPEAGHEMTFIDVSGFAGRSLPARILALFQLVSATLRMKGIIEKTRPELVLGTGGYVSGPAVLAGRWAGVPTVIQEQNSIPGRMNRFLARFVDEIHVAFTESRLHFAQTSKIRLSGNPTLIRQPKGSRTDLSRRWGLDPERRTVLVVGGSRGARSLNQGVAAMLPAFAGRSDVQFIIQTGVADEAMVRDAVNASRVRAVVRAYLSPIEEAYALATMVVCRAGAMTLAEIAQFGLPALLVPFPHAIYQHQLKNAEILAGKDAAEIILDRDLSGDRLAERVTALLADQARRRVLGVNVWNLARPDARERVVNSIEQLTHPVKERKPADWVSGDAGPGQAED